MIKSRQILMYLMLLSSYIFGSGYLTQVGAQGPTIIYNSAGDLNKGYSNSELVIRVVYSASCNDSRIRFGLPNGVSYVTGSVAKVSGAASLTIAHDASSSARNPEFTISGTIGVSDEITFKINRQADCSAALGTGFDSLYFTGSCGNVTMNVATHANATSYSIFSPSLSVTPPPAINNAVVGNTATRTITVTNGGVNSATDTLRFYIVYPGGAIVNTSATNAITANGTSFTPSRTSGDTLFYAIRGATLFNGNNLFQNGEVVTITEPIRIARCGTASNATVYGAGWGRTPATVCTWTTGTSSISNATGAPNLELAFARIGDSGDFCTGDTWSYTITNTGSETQPLTGAARNVTADLGTAGWGTPTMAYLQASTNLVDFSIGGQTVTDIAGPNGGRLVDFSQITAAIPGQGLVDADGDGKFNDLPVGASVTIVYRLVWRTNTFETGCANTNAFDITPNGVFRYTDMCATSTQSRYLSGTALQQSSRYAVGLNPTKTVSGSNNLVPGVLNRLTFSLGHVANGFPGNGPSASPTGVTRLVLKLPTGVTLGPSNGLPTVSGTNQAPPSVLSTTVAGDSVVIDMTHNPGSYVRALSINVQGACPIVNPAVIQAKWLYYNTTCPTALYSFGCISFSMNAMCNPPCVVGISTSMEPVVTRKNLGWTDNTLATRVSASSLSATELKRLLPYDTATVSFNGRQITPSANWNLHYGFDLTGSTPGSPLVPGALGTFTVYRGTNTYTCNLPAPTITRTATREEWNFAISAISSCVPGGLQANDSVSGLFNIVYNGQNSANGLATGGVANSQLFMYNLSATNDTLLCGRWGTEMYLIPIIIQGGNAGSGASIIGCSNVTAQLGGFFNYRENGDLFPNEFRPAFYTDSIKISVPHGVTYDPNNPATLYVPQMNATNPGLQTGSAVELAIGYPSAIRAGATRDTLVYINPGTWQLSDVTYQALFANRIHVRIIGNCQVNEGSFVVTGDFYRRNYYYSKTPATLGTMPTVLSPGAANTNVSYSAKPSVAVANNTGAVQGVQTNQYWDITVSNPSASAAGSVWFALEKSATSGIIVDSVSRRTGATPGLRVTGTTYGSGNTWYQLAGSLGSARDSTYRVYFRYTSCNADSIQLKAGWDCSGFPTNPTNYVCTTPSTWLKVVPQVSEIQASITRQPGAGSSITMCHMDSVFLVMNSAQAANVMNPYVTFTAPTGITLPSTVPVEYPLGSSNIQNVPVVLSGGVYTINVGAHTGVATSGILGTLSATNVNQRQLRIGIKFNTSCTFTSGTAFRFNLYGNRPCATPAIGDGISVTTGSVEITGATLTGTAGISLTFGTAITTSCIQPARLTATVTPVLNNSEATDTLIYTLGDGLKYAGNPTAGLTVIEAGNLVKVLMPATSAGTSRTIAFDVVGAGAFCGISNVRLDYKRMIGGLSCNGTPCANSSAVIGTNTSPNITVQKPDLHVDLVQFVSGVYAPTGTYTAAVTVRNTGSQAAAASTYIVEAFCGSNAAPFAAVTFPSAVAINATVTTNMNFTVPASCNMYDIITYKIRPLTETNTSQCLCYEASYISSQALPVKLISFDATKKGKTSLLTWTTASEENNAGFDIQHSVDGRTWEKIGFVGSKGDQGNSSFRLDYDFVHRTPVQALNYYRLAQKDNNGQVNYSLVKTVEFGLADGIKIYPNPTQDKIRIEGMEANSQIRIYDALGRLMIELKATGTSEDVSLGHLSNGTYQVQVSEPNGQVTVQKIAKQR